MEMRLPGFGGLPSKAPAQRLPLSFSIFVGIVAITTFVMTEVFTVGVAAVWAVAGYFHLALVPSVLLAIIVLVPCLVLGVIVTRLAINAETDPENN